MNKTNNQYHDKVYKTTKGNFFVGGEYERRVNMNLIKEGKEPVFVSQSPSGKRHISKCVLTDTKTETKHYLMLEYFKETPPFSVSYDMDGDMIQKQLFESFMVKKSTPTNQDLERTVNVITVTLSNVRVLHIDGSKYEIIPETVEVEQEP